jgi:hypothetical protein
MKKAMVFSFDEFDTLVVEVTYGVIGFSYDAFDGYHYVMTMNDDDWEEWEEEFGEEAKNDVDRFWDDNNEFVVAMISKKFDAVVEHIIVDYFKDMVAVIFK